MAVLYINSHGRAHRKHSYSSGNIYDQSPLKYKLMKINGWKGKDNKAAFLFGRALEEAIQFHHDHNGEGGIEDFQRRWNAHKDKTDLTFTKTEKDWENLYHCGTEMIKLYVIRQPSLPIPLGGQTSFQREYSKEVFPGDENYGGIEDAGKLDIVCYVQPDHPLLTKLDWKPEYGMLRPLIVDIKTSGVDFDDSPGMAALDGQLQRYSWLSGIRDVAMLWFKKTGRNLQKGSSVTLLHKVGPFEAGSEAVVAYIQNPVKPTKKEPDKRPQLALGTYLVVNDFMLEQMEEAQGRKPDGDLDTTNEAKNRKYDWLARNATLALNENITRQRLQFNCGFVTVEEANDAGYVAADQIVAIVNSWKRQHWPNKFGVRFPRDDRQDPYFRAFVKKDEAFKRDYFKQADIEELDDLFADVEEAE